MATDIAEVIGGAVALWLLFGVPLPVGGLLTGAVSLALLVVQQRARRAHVRVRRDRAPRDHRARIHLRRVRRATRSRGSGLGTRPPLRGHRVGAVGRVDPRRDDHAARDLRAQRARARPVRRRRSDSRPAGIPRLLRATRWDVAIALAIAGTVNLAILLLAAANLAGVPGTDSLEGAYAALHAGLGAAVATLFAVGLFASGLASTAVGAYAGAEIMQGLLRVRVPMLARRLVTLVPAIDPRRRRRPDLGARAQPGGLELRHPVRPALTARADVLGRYRNRWWTTAAGVLAAIFLIVLNGVLLWLVLGGGPGG